jgi:hypothetical protein
MREFVHDPTDDLPLLWRFLGHGGTPEETRQNVQGAGFVPERKPGAGSLSLAMTGGTADGVQHETWRPRRGGLTISTLAGTSPKCEYLFLTRSEI